jgi:hypothetical protein
MYVMMMSHMFPPYFSAIDSTRLIEARELEDIVVSQSKRPREDGYSFKQQGSSTGPSKGQSGHRGSWIYMKFRQRPSASGSDSQSDISGAQSYKPMSR